LARPSQAKRYVEENIVGSFAIERFTGANVIRGSDFGATSFGDYQVEAKNFAKRVPRDIALVGGLKLTELMTRHRVGVQVARRVEM
jgi:restriction system protein